MIYLFFVCLCVNLVSTNPLTNLLLQTRPHCNNGYNTYNVPMQNNQPYVPPITAQNPMTTCPNNQLFGPQNGLPIQIKVDDKNHSYLNKILSNPMVQNILNRNSNHFNQNSQDIALQATPGQTPNVVNNYYIIPSECLQGNGDGIEVVKKIIGDHAVAYKNCEYTNQRNTDIEMNNVQQSHDRPNEEKRRSKGNKRRNPENEGLRNQNNKNPQNRKRKHGHQNNGNQRDNRQGQNQSNNKNRELLKIKDERPRKRNGTQESEPRKNGNKKRKKPKNETVDDIQDDKISSRNDTVSKEIENNPLRKERKNITEVSRNNKDEDVIRDIHNKFPGIPEDVVRRLLRYLRRQLQIKPTSKTDPDANANRTQNNKKDNKRRRNNRKDSKRRRKQKNHTGFVEDTESSTSTPTEGSLITSTMIERNELSNNQVENSPNYKNMQNLTVENAVTETTTNTDIETSKLEENKVPDLENDFDDYFPDFRFDKMYMSEDDYIRSLRDNRFFYTTDRNYEAGNNGNNGESSEIYYEPYEPTISQKVEDTLRRPDEGFFDDQYEEVIKDSIEELEFQTPPILEYPDFETKPIIKYFDAERPIYKPENKNIDTFNDKSSTYSEAKTVNTPLKNKAKSDIEMVFARSKVAKYGQPEEVEEVTIDKNEKSKHDDTILVYAKSVPDPK